MKNKLAVIGQKSLAALTLLFGFAPFSCLRAYTARRRNRFCGGCSRPARARWESSRFA